MKEKDKQVVLNLMHEYIKKHKRFPTLKQFEEESQINKIIMNLIKEQELESQLEEVLKQDFIERVQKGNTKTLFSKSNFSKLSFIK